MRQLFTLRLLAAVAALVALALVARGVLLGGDDPIEAVVDTAVTQRSIDLIEPIRAVAASDDFRVDVDGRTTGFVDLTFDGERQMRVVPGTLGEIACPEFGIADRCAVFADMLGDAVVWFSIRTRATATTVELGPIVDLDGGEAVLTNGWRIPYPPIIERDCPGEDIPTFSDFLRRFGPDSVTIVDLTARQVTTVRCGDDVGAVDG